MKISIKTIQHQYHRYPTLGDYYDKDGESHIFVSDVGNEDAEFLIAIHELIEQYLCRKRGISEESISAFDIAYENSGKDGEPGDEKDAPYYKEHQFATIMERLICQELGIDWREYENFTTEFFNKQYDRAL